MLFTWMGKGIFCMKPHSFLKLNRFSKPIIPVLIIKYTDTATPSFFQMSVGWGSRSAVISRNLCALEFSSTEHSPFAVSPASKRPSDLKTGHTSAVGKSVPGGSREQCWCCLLCFFFFFNFFFNIYFLGQRETEHERGRGRERGRHRIRNRLQALSYQPRARRGAQTHGPRDRDLAEVGRLTDCATQAPQQQWFQE